MKKNDELLNLPEGQNADSAPGLRPRSRLRHFMTWLFCPYRRVLVKIVPHHAESVYKLELSHLHLALAGIGTVVVMVVLLVTHVADVHAAEARVRALQAQDAHQRQELSTFSKQTKLLWQQVNSLQHDDEEIRRLTRVIVSKPKLQSPAHDKATAGASRAKQYGEVVSPGRGQVGHADMAENGRGVEHAGLSPWRAISLWLHSVAGTDGLGFAAEAAELSSLTRRVDETGRQTRALETGIRAAAEAKIAQELARERYLAAIPSIWPTLGYVSSGFGYRSYPDYGFHSGLDIVNDYGAPIVATASGTVVEADWYYGYGYRVIIDHGNGLRSMYAHASRLLVQAGQVVKKGQEIAEIGESGFATGPHVHYELELWGKPIDPTPYLSGSVKIVAQT